MAGFDGLMFDYSAEPTKGTPQLTEADTESVESSSYDPLGRIDKSKEKKATSPDVELEGFNDDATLTKVVDRRWFERNKHIFPASVWTEFSPEKDFSTSQRKDAEGNSFFLS